MYREFQQNVNIADSDAIDKQKSQRFFRLKLRVFRKRYRRLDLTRVTLNLIC